MPQIPVDKTFFTFSKGFLTEVSPLNFPDEVSLEEENFELLPDGSRRRRRGIAVETDTIAISLQDELEGDEAMQAFVWKHVDLDSQQNFVLIQVGLYVYVYEENEVLGGNYTGEIINLADSVTTTAAEARTVPISFTSGRGHLFIASTDLEPSYVTYDANAATKFEVNQIGIKVRDYVDIDDGVDLLDTPSDDPDNANKPTPSHHYNLANRGWAVSGYDGTAGSIPSNPKGSNGVDYRHNNGVWASKAMLPWVGWRRSTVEDSNWYSLSSSSKVWDSSRFDEEILAYVPAPNGSLIINPFDTRTAIAPLDGDSYVLPNVYTSNFYPTGLGTSTLTFRLDLGTTHTLNVGDTIEIGPSSSNLITYLNHDGNKASIEALGGDLSVLFRKHIRIMWRLYPKHVVTNVGSSWIEWELPAAWGVHATSLYDNTWNKPATVTNSVLDNPEGEVTTKRPSCCEYYAGRIVFGGLNTSRWSDVIFYSKIIYDDNDYEAMLQMADPTHPVLNELLPDDGGTIQIPGLGTAIEMVTFQGSLLVFGNTGVWEISGSQAFAADDIIVRKITEAEAINKQGIIKTDDVVIFASHRGIYAIGGDGQTGRVQAQNITEPTIQKYWNDLGTEARANCQMAYDDSLRRVHILVNESNDDSKYYYDAVLTFDQRLGAFYRYTFNKASDNYIGAFVALSVADDPSTYQKVKYFNVVNNRQLRIADQSVYAFTDYDSSEKVPYLITGYDNLGDWSRKRYAPVIHTYMERTEEAWEDDGSGNLVVDNPSSCTMQARWDWTDSSNANKFGTAQQVYKHRRVYTPTQAGDAFDNGEPVVVVRSKVRGRGRALNLKFTGEEGKDCHLLGWAIHYEGDNKV